MPKVSYDCVFCGKGDFSSEKECRIHEKSCEKNPKNTIRKQIEFFYDENKKEIQSKEVTINSSEILDNSHDHKLFLAGQDFPQKGYAIIISNDEIENLKKEYKKKLIERGMEIKKKLSEEYTKISNVIMNISSLEDDEEFKGIADFIHQLYKIVGNQP